MKWRDCLRLNCAWYTGLYVTASFSAGRYVLETVWLEPTEGMQYFTREGEDLIFVKRHLITWMGYYRMVWSGVSLEIFCTADTWDSCLVVWHSLREILISEYSVVLSFDIVSTKWGRRLLTLGR